MEWREDRYSESLSYEVMCKLKRREEKRRKRSGDFIHLSKQSLTSPVGMPMVLSGNMVTAPVFILTVGR